MEKLTPLELERAQIPTSFRGYDKESVNRLLSGASHQLEAQLVEIRRLQALLTNSELELERFRSQESTLNSALILAQKAADETRALAHRESELIIEAAQLEAKDIRRQANDSVIALKWDIERLDQERLHVVSRIKNLLLELDQRITQEGPTHAVLEVQDQEVATG